MKVGSAKAGNTTRPEHEAPKLSGRASAIAEPCAVSSSPPANSADATSATDMAVPGTPRTRTTPSAISRSSAEASSFSDAIDRIRRRTSAAAAITARPLLKVVWLPELPMSQAPASVSWYRIETRSGLIPSSSAAMSARPITAPEPFSCAPVTRVAEPSVFTFKLTEDAAGKLNHHAHARPIPSPAAGGFLKPISSAAFTRHALAPTAFIRCPVGPSSPSWSRLRTRIS